MPSYPCSFDSVVDKFSILHWFSDLHFELCLKWFKQCGRSWRFWWRDVTIATKVRSGRFLWGRKTMCRMQPWEEDSVKVMTSMWLNPFWPWGRDDCHEFDCTTSTRYTPQELSLSQFQVKWCCILPPILIIIITTIIIIIVTIIMYCSGNPKVDVTGITDISNNIIHTMPDVEVKVYYHYYYHLTILQYCWQLPAVSETPSICEQLALAALLVLLTVLAWQSVQSLYNGCWKLSGITVKVIS